MTIPTGTRVPFLVIASLTDPVVIPQPPGAALSYRIQRRILRRFQSARPVGTPFTQDLVDSRFDDV